MYCCIKKVTSGGLLQCAVLWIGNVDVLQHVVPADEIVFYSGSSGLTYGWALRPQRARRPRRSRSPRFCHINVGAEIGADCFDMCAVHFLERALQFRSRCVSQHDEIWYPSSCILTMATQGLTTGMLPGCGNQGVQSLQYGVDPSPTLSRTTPVSEWIRGLSVLYGLSHVKPQPMK